MKRVRGATLHGVWVAAALAVMLAGCGGSDSGSDDDVPVSETIEDVDYYFACGNEVLELPDGRRFYPFEDQDAVDEGSYLSAPTPQAASRILVATTLAVPPPETGDDIGTLTIYADGTARFVSESGTEAWLTDEERTYNWDC
ncbi:MAG: hypothetical protein ACOCT8_04140 [Actinomycetota bacterium]